MIRAIQCCLPVSNLWIFDVFWEWWFLGMFVSLSIQALDKIRFESLTDKTKLDAQPELFIHIIPDKTNNTLTIVDSGIGMTKAGKSSWWEACWV